MNVTRVVFWDADAGRQLERDATPDEIAEIALRKAQAERPQVPQSVPMAQARKALSNAGLYASTNALLASLPGPQGENARIDWEFQLEVRRDSPLLLALASQLGLADSALDELFIAASKI